MAEGNKKVELELEEIEVEDMVALIDDMMNQGVGRLKVKTSKELSAGELLKEYHHGRCDINSPYAKGTPYDVLEDE